MNKLVELVKHYESLHDGDLKKQGVQPKLDSIGIVTVGYGRALADRGGSWLKGQDGLKKAAVLYPNLMNITIKQAEEMLEIDLKDYTLKVQKVLNQLKISLTENQLFAVVSICYNCGIGCLIKDGKPLTLGRVLQNTNRTKEDVDKAFGLWNKAGGKVLPGLTYRRKTEAFLFNEGEIKFFN